MFLKLLYVIALLSLGINLCYYSRFLSDLLKYPGIIEWTDNEHVFPAILSVAFNLTLFSVVVQEYCNRTIFLCI